MNSIGEEDKKEYCSILENVAKSLLFLKEKKGQCSLKMLPGVALSFTSCVLWDVLLEVWRSSHGARRIQDGVCCVVSKNYIQVIVFDLLAQTEVIHIYIYICIYINLLTKCLENIPRNTNISNK